MGIYMYRYNLLCGRWSKMETSNIKKAKIKNVKTRVFWGQNKNVKNVFNIYVP